MKKYIKILCVLLLIVQVLFLLQTISFATTDAFDFSRFDNKGEAKVDSIAKTSISTAISVIRVVGTGTAVIMLSYMGIKYMMASPAEKADFKKSAVIFVVGAILIFAASNILTFILRVTESIL